MSAAAAKALADASSVMNVTLAPGRAVRRYGPALPTVSAPTIVPTANPRCARNHVDAIFIAGDEREQEHNLSKARRVLDWQPRAQRLLE